MNASQINSYVEKLFDDEAILFSKILENRVSQTLDGMIIRESNRPFCDKCGCEMKKNGTDGHGHQKWICKECGLTHSSSTGKPTVNTKKKAITWLKMISCELHNIPLRESASLCNISLATAFYLRQKLQYAISEYMSNVCLKGRVELDGKRFRINLKGTKPYNMLRKSKHRGYGVLNGHHQLTVIFAIDEMDNMFAKIVGLGAESKEKAELIYPFIKDCSVLVTDYAYYYNVFAKEHSLKHIRVLQRKHITEERESINRVNSLMSDYETWVSRYRGISSRHLQGYLDRFLFQKMIKKAFSILDQPSAEMSVIFKTNAVISCRDILLKAMPIDLYEAFGEYHYGIFKEKHISS